MAENTTQTDSKHVAESETEQKPHFLQRVTTNHPKLSRVAAITGAIGTAVGAVAVAANLRSNKDQLDSAGDNAHAALDDLSSSVSPTDPTA